MPSYNLNVDDVLWSAWKATIPRCYTLRDRFLLMMIDDILENQHLFKDEVVDSAVETKEKIESKMDSSVMKDDHVGQPQATSTGVENDE